MKPSCSAHSLFHLRGGAGGRNELTKLQQQLTPIGLMIRDVKGDGNCLFRAVADQ